MGETNMDLCEIHTVGRQTRESIVDARACPALSLYGIGLAGLSQAATPFRFVREQPRFSQILACVSGWGEVWLGDRWARCATGEAYVTPAGAGHGYRAVDGTRWSLAWVIYSAVRPAPKVESPALVRLDPRPFADAVQGLYRESMGAAEPGLTHQWAHLVHAYAQRALGPSVGGADARLRALWERVDAHLTHPWTVDELAREAGTSGEHLRRLCQGQTGRSPLRHVAFLRMRRAAALLSTQSYTVEAVAQQVGYENPFAFSTAFKRHQGMPPSEFRGESAQSLQVVARQKEDARARPDPQAAGDGTEGLGLGVEGRERTREGL